MVDALSFDAQPTLIDPLVTLRPLGLSDWPALYDVASDPLIWEGHPARDRWREPVFRRFFESALESGGALVALDPTTETVIGSSRYDRSRVHHDEIEIGWTFLARACWGGRINAAVKRVMVGHALKTFGRAVFLIGDTNARSQVAAQRIGARLTDRVRETELDGRIVRHLVYAIDRADFLDGPLNRTVPHLNEQARPR